MSESEDTHEEQEETTSANGNVEKEKVNDDDTGDNDEKVISENGDSESPKDNDKQNGVDKQKEEEEDVCEVIDEESNMSKPEVGDVITVDDKGEDIPSKTIPDNVFFENVSEEEKKFYEDKCPSQQSLETMNIQCTACWKQVNHHIMNSVMRHPVLGVAICRQCRDFYDGDGEDWEKDEEGVDLYCRWCGQGGEVVGCDECKYVFCKKCITRNLGRGKFAEINDSDKWCCFSCDPSQIYKERALMCSLAKWMAELKVKKRLQSKLKSEKKKTEVRKKKAEENRKQKEVKFEQEANKVDNFVDEAFHEAFETLNIYQKCLQDEQKKWIKQRKNMNPNNTAAIVKSLRKIFSITKQNMELLDTTLVQGYNMVYPDENEKKIKVAGVVDVDESFTASTPVKTPRKTPSKKRKREPNGNGDDIEVEDVVVNGESVLDNDDDDAFDPSLLCSVEITAVDRESSSEPELKRPKPKQMMPKIAPQRGPLKLSNSMFKKKKKSPLMKKSPLKMKKRPKRTSEIEEITLTDDEDENSTSYVTQSEVDENAEKKILAKANKFINNDSDDAIDSDVSLE